MNTKQENQFKCLVEFLGKVLGPDYEITLHNLSKKHSSLVAISNGHISGRAVGAPSTGFLEKMLALKEYETSDYVLSSRGRAINDRILRTSSFFIKNEAQKPTGILCISFDDSRYRELSKKLLTLCHPNSFIEQNMVFSTTLPSPEAHSYDTFYSDAKTAMDETLSAAIRKINGNLERLTREEKVKIVTILYEDGFFHIKGAVPFAAEKLNSSVASIYRYLKDAKPLVDHID